VIDDAACLRLPETLFDLRDEAEPLDRIFDRRVLRKSLKRLDDPLLLGVSWHKPFYHRPGG